MKALKPFFRLTYISYVLLKHGLDEIVFEAHLLPGLALLTRISPFRYTKQRQKPRGVRLREALEELGPIFVKLGQLLSTRPDIIPEDIIQELRLLQDKVPPFAGKMAIEMIETALLASLDHLFKKFDSEALASASVAQVHAATLWDGKEVVVKVLRPNVSQAIQKDIATLKTIAKLSNRYSKRARQFKPLELVLEFEKTLHFELDLMREGANASQLKRNFSNSTLLQVPKIYWEYSKNTVLVMERVYGIPIYQVSELKQQGFNLKKLAEVCVEVFFTQVFRDCFFHADMHPGNLRVASNNPMQPSLIAMDFGIMGSLNPDDQRYLAENFLALFKRDYRRVAELHLKSGWIPPHTNLVDFESSLRTVCEPMFERPIKEISIGQLLLRLFQTASEFQINIQPQLILLQKTLLNVEGLARTLYPELDLWQTAGPFLQKWMKTQVGPRAFLRKLRSESPHFLERLNDLPELLYSALFKDRFGDAAYYPVPRSGETSVVETAFREKTLARHQNLNAFYIICLAALLGFSMSVIVIFLMKGF